MVPRKGVRCREVSAIERFDILEYDRSLRLLVPRKGVRYREVSAIKHVPYREVSLYYIQITQYVNLQNARQKEG